MSTHSHTCADRGEDDMRFACGADRLDQVRTLAAVVVGTMCVFGWH